MLKIERSSNSSNTGVIFTLIGRIEIEDVAELQRILDLEKADQCTALNMKDVTLIDRDAVRLLAQWEANDIRLEHCPAYLRGWIDREKKRQ